MNINPYLHFNGNCEAAFKFYETALHGKIQFLMRYGEAPADAAAALPAGSPVPGDPLAALDKIMHINLTAGGASLLGSDMPPGHISPRAAGFTISIQVPDPAEATRVFNALAAGGAIRMPLQKTFWAQLFGMVTDQFGMPWLINCA